MYRVIFLGLITCLSGSSYIFIIAVIFLLRRQFRKPEQETERQRSKGKEIELKTTLSATEDQLTAPKSHIPRVLVRMASELEEEGDVQRTERLAKDGGQQESLCLTEATVEPSPSPANGAMLGPQSEEEESEQKDEVSTESNIQVDKESTEDKDETQHG
ncbi:unnamed protein product [Pleuronectes platessa]|uniref:Uncharacterized protein n=1 Tax=Pleuronectes platessa TaxID=8262 RepID=A0A9N7TKB5_PLEPL|nr:unnamed protein product [Pleuronectes platessa]